MSPESTGYAPASIFISVDLPAPLWPEQRDDFAGVEVDADAVDGVHAAECLADVVQLDKRRRRSGIGCHHFSPKRRRYNTSNTTATISTWPMITMRLPIATSSSSIPLSSDCMISAPSTEPRIEPLPPDERRAADHGSRDHVELHPGAERIGACIQPRDRDDRRDRDE